jgi:disulfide bond formation protein DsbB
MRIRKRLLAILALPVIAVGLVIGATTASATTATPTAKTCAAFAKWDHARTTGNLDAMLTASMAAPWRYVGEDAAGLYSDVRDGAAGAKYVVKDVTYFAEDC